MQELKELARKLLSEGAVKVVIGYEQGPRGARPAFITKPDDAERLIFDSRCVHNLAVYLSPRRAHIAALGKPAVVIKGCDARAVAGLIRESQLKRENVVLIGVRCNGVFKDPAVKLEAGGTDFAERCIGCAVREPKLVDHLIGELKAAPSGQKTSDARIKELEALSPDERFAFWKAELKKCIRCHACREVCPMCFCVRCVADKSQPQWIETSAHLRANLAWNMTRALHLAGRCTGCGECERACPANIPLGLLNRKAESVMEERFEYQPNDDPEKPAPIGVYRLEDAEEFIL